MPHPRPDVCAAGGRDIIREVKRAVKVPVIGNGDVTDAVSAAALYEHTGCDLVMVGRGALGAPWVFAQIQAYLGSGVRLPDPPVEKRMAVLLRQARLTAELKGERIALREIRKHAAWYMRGLRVRPAFQAQRRARWRRWTILLCCVCRRLKPIRRTEAWLYHVWRIRV